MSERGFGRDWVGYLSSSALEIFSVGWTGKIRTFKRQRNMLGHFFQLFGFLGLNLFARGIRQM